MGAAERNAQRKRLEAELLGAKDDKDARKRIVGQLAQLQREELRESIDENADGTMIVRLVMPPEVNGTKHRKLTVRPVKVRDVRAVGADGGSPEEYAARLVEPPEAFDELECERDYSAVLVAVDDQLGKFRRTGWEASP